MLDVNKINMIKNIIDLLNTSDWYVGDEDIDIAKGKYEAPKSLKQLITSVKRNTYKGNGRN
jgi:hypothetical protein